jgi:UDP-N-acetylglucosamine 1-carboxyvinyltransferase
MDRIRIIGGQPLKGTIPISGAKNAALPLMIASLLTRETLTLKNIPRLADVMLLGRILGNHGIDITSVGKKVGQSTTEGQTFKLKAAEIVDTTAPYEMVSRMRASFWVLAPLLARCGEAKVSLPGGLCHRYAAGGFAPGGARGAWRIDRACGRLCYRQGAERLDPRQGHAFQSVRRRHP